MKKTIRLNESELIKLVKRIIDKQDNINLNRLKESSEFGMNFKDTNNKDVAKRSLIALSKGHIRNNKIKIDGRLRDAHRDENGHYSEDGDVEIQYYFEGIKFDLVLNVTGSYYYEKGWGGDYMQPPDHDTYQNEEIVLNDDEIIVNDENDYEYKFDISELGFKFSRNMEDFLLDYYNPEYSSFG